jgi:iron transport multicopper oxidase
LITTNQNQSLFDVVPDTLNPNATGWLTYSDSTDFSVAIPLDEFVEFDDFTLVPVDGMETLPDPGQTVSLDLIMDNLGDGAN